MKILPNRKRLSQLITVVFVTNGFWFSIWLGAVCFYRRKFDLYIEYGGKSGPGWKAIQLWLNYKSFGGQPSKSIHGDKFEWKIHKRNLAIPSFHVCERARPNGANGEHEQEEEEDGGDSKEQRRQIEIIQLDGYRLRPCAKSMCSQERNRRSH